jgi:tape measure domain-containing protein
VATERFIIGVEARGTRRVKRDIDAIGKSARTTQRTLAFLRSALVVVASARVLQNLSQFVDAFTNIQNRIRLVTDSTRQLNAVTRRLFTLSQETRTSFATNAELFQRLARSTQGLNLTFGELFGLTDTITKALALSGATAQEASNGLIQFAQGLASGTLRGDELRSVVEQLPALADAIGEEFGVAGGQLIAFAKANEGILTTERVLRGIEKASGDIDAAFQNTEVTVGQALTRVQNALQFFLGGLSNATGASRALAQGLTFVAENIDRIALALVALGGLLVFNLITAQVIALIARLRALLTLIVRGIGIAAVKAIFALTGALKGVAGLLRVIRGLVLTNPLFLIGAGVIAGVVGAFFLLANAISSVEDVLSRLGQLVDNIVAAFLAGLETIVLRWRDLPAAFLDLGTQAANALIGQIERAVGGAVSVLNVLPGIDLDPPEFGRITNAAEGAAASIGETFDSVFQRIEEGGGGIAELQRRFEQIQSFVEQFTARGAGLSPDELAQLNEALPTQQIGAAGEGNIGQGDGLSKSDLDSLRSSVESLVSSVSPLQDAIFQVADATETLNAAEEAGIDIGLRREEVLRRLRREIVGVGNDTTGYREQLKLLNEALQDGVINQQEFTRAARDLRISFLDDQTSLAAGFERTFLKLTRDAADGASFIEESISGAFRGVEDAIVQFAETGKLAIDDFAQQVQADLLRLATRGVLKTVVGGLGNLLFGALGGGGFGGGIGLGLGLGGPGAAGLTGFQDGGTFPVNRQNSVGEVPGVDNRVVAFRANDSEEVEVRKKGAGGDKGGRGGMVVNQTFNIQTSDAESFQRSQGQILTKAGAAISRATRRNG